MEKFSSISTFSIQRPFLLYYYPETVLLVSLRAVSGFKINKKGHLGGYHPPRMTFIQPLYDLNCSGHKLVPPEKNKGETQSSSRYPASLRQAASPTPS